MQTTEWPDLMKGQGGDVRLQLCEKNSSTKLSPHEVMYGVTLWSPKSVTLSDHSAYVSPEDHVDEHQATRPGVYCRVWENSTQARYKTNGPKKIRDPGFAESKVWDLDRSWTLHVLFVVGPWKPKTAKL